MTIEPASLSDTQATKKRAKPNLALPTLQGNDTQEISCLQEYHRTQTLRTMRNPQKSEFGLSLPERMNTTVEWSSPVGTLSLSEDEVHLWRASLAVDPSALGHLKSTLAQNELERAERFIFDPDRDHFIAARGILRDVLGRYLQCAPQTIDFVYGARGKPAISNAGSRHPLRFNLSHSHGLAVIGIARERELGIDVEMIRPNFASEEIAKRYFSAKEIDELSGLPVELQTEGFFLCWTRKEAYIKATGEGLHIPLDSFDVSLTPGLRPELNSSDRSRWSLRSLVPGFGYVAAVVGEGSASQLRHFNWAP
jgi:4'-phosphopantetheinyl transferase